MTPWRPGKTLSRQRWRRCARPTLGWAWCALAAACAGGPPPLHVARVLIDTPADLDAVPALRDAAHAAVQAVLTDDPSVVQGADAGLDSERGHVVHVQVGAAQADGAAAGARSVAVRLRTRLAGPSFAATAVSPPQGDPVAATAAGFARAWQAIATQRRLEVADASALLAALADPELRDYAVARAGSRRLRAAVPPLCALLRDETLPPETALRVVGALVEIGARQAVGPLIDLGRLRPPEFVTQLAFAIGSLGGRKAEAYLVTLAGGHADAEVRRAARDALGEMQRPRAR